MTDAATQGTRDMSFLDTIKGTLFGEQKPGPNASGKRKSADKRSTRRVPQRMRSGSVWSDKLITPRNVVVKDMSLGGARVEIVGGEAIKPALLINGLVLYLDSEKHEIKCRVAWARGQQIGLEFLGKPGPPSRTYKTA
ncbi:MAG: PilZ domain-containing protein [Hyphomicrobium sp.]|uniref:PilZ domain-containing protein n=1 Tax=Hyphomicrobium sp. TaxID=82 RepID=UPI003D09C944